LRFVEQQIQDRARQPQLDGTLVAAAYLPDDFDFAYAGRIQAGGNQEQVLGGPFALPGAQPSFGLPIERGPATQQLESRSAQIGLRRRCATQKNQLDAVARGEITEFMRQMKYRLLCTATAAPNDYTELGTSSEALGDMGHVDMLERFFVNNKNTQVGGRIYRTAIKWILKPHARDTFWRWVCSWARACRNGLRSDQLPGEVGGA